MLHWMRKTLPVTLLLTGLSNAVPAVDSPLTSRQVLNILERRQSNCPSSNPVSCAAVDSKLPSNFCCSSGSSCISLDSSSTALCCPSGSSCATISTIDCDVSLQDPTTHSSGPVFTTKLSSSLSKCANSNQCCPFGYTCGVGSDGSAVCQIVANKAITQQPSSSTSSATASTPTLASTTSAKGSATASKSISSATSTSNTSPASTSSLDSTKPPLSSSSNPFPPGVFLAGFFPGMLVGALGVLAWVILTGRHKKADDNASATSSVYRRKPYISDPVPLDAQNARTDFLRRTNTVAKSAKSLFTRRPEGEGTPGLPFDSWKMPTPPEPNNIPDRPMGQQIPVKPGVPQYYNGSGHPPVANYPQTPERQIYGNHSDKGRETIHIYSPGDIEVPSATVAPLRGMNSRGRPRSSEVGGLSGVPGGTNHARAPNNTAQTAPYPSEMRYEALSPARYNGGLVQKRPRPENGGAQSRPETTFTDMLEAINFPDPMNNQAPRMPEMPKQYRGT